MLIFKEVKEMDERKKNNSVWVVDEFSEWIEKAVVSVNDLCDSADVYSQEYARLLEKSRTLEMVKQKFDELKYE